MEIVTSKELIKIAKTQRDVYRMKLDNIIETQKARVVETLNRIVKHNMATGAVVFDITTEDIEDIVNDSNVYPQLDVINSDPSEPVASDIATEYIIGHAMDEYLEKSEFETNVVVRHRERTHTNMSQPVLSVSLLNLDKVTF